MRYKRNGDPYPEGEEGLLEWGKDFSNPEIKVVKQETLKNGKWVSTIWLGINHQFGLGKPLIFETMVFPEEGKFGSLDCQRYFTEEEAIKGHEEMVKKYDQPR